MYLFTHVNIFSDDLVVSIDLFKLTSKLFPEYFNHFFKHLIHPYCCGMVIYTVQIQSKFIRYVKDKK